MKRNWYMISGILLFAAILILDHTVDIPDAISGFGMGTGIGLELTGIVTQRLGRIRAFKERLLHGSIR